MPNVAWSNRKTWHTFFLQWQRILAMWIVIFIALLAFNSLTAFAASDVSTVPDDEIVLIDAAGHIRVVDPYIPPFLQPVTFQSTSKGWKSVALGDVNGDGDAEIVALRGDQIRIFDPVVQPGRTRVQWYMTSPEGEWTALTLGDLDGDGQAEIVASHTSLRTPIVAQIVVLDPNEDASAFTTVFTKDLDIPVMKLDTGDVDGDGWDDVVVIGDIRALFYAFQGGMWDTLFYTVEPKPWVDLKVAQTHKDSASEEIAVLRAVPADMDSYLLYRWLGGGNRFVLDRVPYYPNMTDVSAYDMNGDGDEELLFVRPNDSQVPIVVRNPAGYALPRDISIWGGPGWKRIAGGDLDGDGWGEIVVLKEHAYRVYTEPEISDAFTQEAGDFRLALAVGNLDGAGIPVKPVLHVSANQVVFHYEAYTPVPAQAVVISNAGGGGPIAWSASVMEGGDWLSILPSSGVTPGTLTISVDPYHLLAGTYEGKIRVSAAGALESPQVITVTLTVVTPVLEIQPRNVAFDVQKGHPPVNRTVAVHNIGVGGSIGWHATVVEGASWLRIEPDEDTTPAELTAIIDPSSMEAGLYVGSVRVEADDPVVSNSPITLTVVATIRPPVMQVTPQFIYLNVRPDEEYEPPKVNIVQYGVPEGHAIHWVAGVIPAGPEGGLERGGVQFDLSAIEAVSEKAVVFRKGSYRVTVPTLDWVQIEPWYGVTPGVAFVRVNNEAMAPGIYYATIIIDGGKGTENRFQGVDLKVVIPAQQAYFPVVTTFPYPW